MIKLNYDAYLRGKITREQCIARFVNLLLDVLSDSQRVIETTIYMTDLFNWLGENKTSLSLQLEN